MKGVVDKYSRAMLEIVLSGMRKEITTLAVIDTGFEGDICLPVGLAIQLGLELYDEVEMKLADGSIKSALVFKGVVMLGEEQKTAEIILTESQDVLIGTGLFKDKRLTIDFTSKVVEIE